MQIDCRCPHCSAEYTVDSSELCTKASCEVCGHAFIVDNHQLFRPNIVESVKQGLTKALWRFPRKVKCPTCGREALEWQQKELHRCSCGASFNVQKGMSEYKRCQDLIAKICQNESEHLADLKAQRKTKGAFRKEVLRFEQEWEIFSDERMPRKIERLKEINDRLYKKLQVLSANRIASTVRYAAESNAAVGNTFEGAAGLFVSLLGSVGAADANNEAARSYGSAKEIEQAIAKNEWCMDHYYEITEEFTGHEKEDALSQRLIRLFGTNREEDLQDSASPEEIKRLEQDLAIMRQGRFRLQKEIAYYQTWGVVLAVPALIVVFFTISLLF